MPAQTQPFDCPGNYMAVGETTLRCAKCNRPLMVKDAKRTPTGYVCPYFVKSRVATFYNAKPIHYVVAGLVAFVGGIVTGIAVSLIGMLGFFSLIVMFFAAPAIGGGVAEVARRALRAMNNARGQYIWLVEAICLVLGAAYFVILPALVQVMRFSPAALNSLIPVLGLVLATGTLVARARI